LFNPPTTPSKFLKGQHNLIKDMFDEVFSASEQLSKIEEVAIG